MNPAPMVRSWARALSRCIEGLCNLHGVTTVACTLFALLYYACPGALTLIDIFMGTFDFFLGQFDGPSVG